MKYNFDNVIDRTKTSCAKWSKQSLDGKFNGNVDVFPMWVADMDFQVSKGILSRIQKVVDNQIFGYACIEDDYYDAIIHWNKKNHNWNVSKEWIVFTAGIVAALNYIVQEFTKEGEGILIQTPVYYPFKNAIVNNNRVLISNPLIDTGDTYKVNFEDMEKKIVENNVKLFILSSPHNPAGRVWTKDELTKMGEICLKYNVLVVADEIHHDLILFGNKHTVFADISKEFAMNSITCTAPSKTFNLAGLHASSIIIPNKEIRDKYRFCITKLGVGGINCIALEAVKGAYLESDDWYEEVLVYIENNYRYLKDYIKQYIPSFKVYPLEGTYLAWIDVRNMGWTREEAVLFFEEKAKLGVDHGFWFGDDGDGFFRLNIACPRSLLEEGLNRIKNNI